MTSRISNQLTGYMTLRVVSCTLLVTILNFVSMKFIVNHTMNNKFIQTFLQKKTNFGHFSRR